MKLTTLITTITLTLTTLINPTPTTQPTHETDTQTKIQRAQGQAFQTDQVNLGTMKYNTTIYPGMQIATTTDSCSLGPKATYQGKTGYLIAAHCGQPGQTIHADNPHYDTQEIGKITTHFDTRDLAFAEIKQGYITSNQLPYGNTLPNNGLIFENLEELAETAPDLCKIGSTTGSTCGRITGYDISTHRAEAYIENNQGDSGGIVYALARGHYVPVGIVSALTIENNTVFIPLTIEDMPQGVKLA